MSLSGSVLYRLAADMVLAVHVLFVVFAVLGLCLILVGAARGWRWIHKPLFRWLHLLGIGVVVLQAWLGRRCPLTDLEMALRERAGEATYPGAFLAHWLERLLYYDLPAWVFVLVYTLFGALVLAAWYLIPPRRRH